MLNGSFHTLLRPAVYCFALPVLSKFASQFLRVTIRVSCHASDPAHAYDALLADSPQDHHQMSLAYRVAEGFRHALCQRSVCDEAPDGSPHARLASNALSRHRSAQNVTYRATSLVVACSFHSPHQQLMHSDTKYRWRVTED